MQTFAEYVNEDIKEERKIDRLVERLRDFVYDYRIGDSEIRYAFYDKIEKGYPIEPVIKKYIYGRIKKLCTDTEKFLSVHNSKNDLVYSYHDNKKTGKNGYDVIVDLVKEAKIFMEDYAKWARSLSIFYTAMNDRPDMIKSMGIDQLIDKLAEISKAKFFSLKQRKYIPFMKSFDPKKIRADFEEKLKQNSNHVKNLYVTGPYSDKDFIFSFAKESRFAIPTLYKVETDF